MIQINEVIRELKEGIEACVAVDDDKKFIESKCEDNDENSFVIKYFDHDMKEEDKYRVIVEKL